MLFFTLNTYQKSFISNILCYNHRSFFISKKDELEWTQPNSSGPSRAYIIVLKWKKKWFTEGFEFKSQKRLNFRFLWDSNSWPFVSETSDLSIRPPRQGGGREKNIVVTLNFTYLLIDLLNLTLKYETKMKIDFQLISKFHNCIDSSCYSLKQLSCLNNYK